ncbi:MAG: ATP-dependent DNA helicase RecQ [Spirochaetota bacterium]
MQEARELLRVKFGFDDFRPGQAQVIGHLLAGSSAAAVFPTGSGKSLCYQIPALMLPGITIVISPLIALMKDQIDRLEKLGIAAARMDSTLDAGQSAQVMRDLREGSLKLLYVAPERFNNERFREAIKRTRISLFAVDEAHCISEWGHNFRPDYLKLATLAKEYSVERVLALTATATPQVLLDVCKGFGIEAGCAVRTGFYRPNLDLLATAVEGKSRDALLQSRLAERGSGPTIVYVTLQRTAEEVAARLAGSGFDARAYHAGMETAERSSVQDWFFASRKAIVVATIAFGMGIDKSDIRAVYHYNLPKSLENYSQEIGRAGRDGLSSLCEAFVSVDDLNTLENFIYGDGPSLASIRALLGEVFACSGELELSLYDCSYRHDIRQLVLRTLLTYLELDGYLREGTPFYSEYRFKALVPVEGIPARFEGERRDFVAKILDASKRAKTWHSLDLEETAEALDSPRERIVRALDYLAEKGWIELEAAGVRNRFAVLESPPDLDALAADLYQRTERREERELSRITQVLGLFQHEGCLAEKLGSHFGEQLPEPCGHCSWCRTKKALQLPPRARPIVDEARWATVEALRVEKRELLGDSRALARFLCGLSTPRTSRARLGSHPLYGAFSEFPFQSVLERARASSGK